MIVYRITRAQYADSLDGKGAARSNSNRWNSRGTEILYASESEALARAELSGHVNLSLLPDAVLMKIQIPEDEIEIVSDLPEGWTEVPPLSISKTIGDEFVNEGRHMGIAVPSRYDKTKYNYLLNPAFKFFSEKVKILEVIKLK